MRVARLQLRNFRNYRQLDVEFAAGWNVLFGRNAEGKTNVLEALFFLATARSHRTPRDQELITWGEAELQARAHLEAAGESTIAELQLRDHRKVARLNGHPQPRLLDFVGRLKAVLFSPDDLQLLKGSPVLRRRFLDLQLAQISRPYLHHLQQYVRALQHRNALLRRGHPPAKWEIEVWEQQLAEHGGQLLTRRAKLLQALDTSASRYHRELSAGREALHLAYAPALPAGTPYPEPEEAAFALQKALEERRSHDIARRSTSTGPHRDDFALHLDGREARLYASQGQQRSAVLALKLAELDHITQAAAEPPLLLLDDVTSELDSNRRYFLLQVVPRGAQLFLTTATLTELDPGWLRDASLFQVQGGRLQPTAAGNT